MPGASDPGVTLTDFGGLVLVVCPRCQRRAEVVPWPPVAGAPAPFAPRRLACASCGYTAAWAGRGVAIGDERDPWFRELLWLRTDVGGEVLWAWNADHLGQLASFIVARQRPRTRSQGAPSTMLERLPAWMKRRGARADVLAGLERLRASLD